MLINCIVVCFHILYTKPTRDKNITKVKHAKLKSTKLSDIESVITPLYDKKDIVSPHCVMELLDREWK